MGLSSEERLKKFYWRMTWIRRHLAALAEAIPTNDGSGWDHAHELVSEWSSTIDDMVGAMVKKTDSSRSFWLLGSPPESFQSLWTDHYNLGSQGSPAMTRVAELPGHEFREALNRWSYRDAAESWAHPNDRNSARIIAAWWDLWDQIDGTLYPVFRYDDDLFEPIIPTLLRWIGALVNNRYHLAAYQMYRDAMLNSEGYDKLRRLEHALLCRVEVVHLLAEPMEYADGPTLAEQKCMAEHAKHPRGAFATATMMSASDPSANDFRDLVIHVGTMGLSTVKKHLDDADRAKRERERESRLEHDGKEPKDRLLGPTPPSAGELEELIDDEDAPMEKRREAVRILRDVYRVYWDPLPKEEE